MYDCTVNIDYREPNPKRKKKKNLNRVEWQSSQSPRASSSRCHDSVEFLFSDKVSSDILSCATLHTSLNSSSAFFKQKVTLVKNLPFPPSNELCRSPKYWLISWRSNPCKRNGRSRPCVSSITARHWITSSSCFLFPRPAAFSCGSRSLSSSW